MSWLELDDAILDHPKFVRLVTMVGGDGPFLWLGLRAYCGKQLTDGFVPDDMLVDVRGPRDAKKRAAALAALRGVKLLDEADGGVQMHNYLKWSRSRAVVLESRRKNAERQAKSRGSNNATDGVSRSVTTRVVTSSVTTPSPLPLQALPDQNKPPPPSVVPPQGADIAKADLDSFSPDPAVISGKRKPGEKKPRPAKWSRFPSDFEPDESHQKLAAELGLNLAQQLAEIRDHEFKSPKSDAAATLRTWLRNAVKFGPAARVQPRNQPQPKQPNGGSWKPRVAADGEF